MTDSEDRARATAEELEFLRSSLVQLRNYAVRLADLIESTQDRLEPALELVMRTQQDLRLVSRQAEASERMKAEFIVNMTHELRTPLTAIIGFVDLLVEGDLTPESRVEYQQAVQRNVIAGWLGL